MNTGHWLGILFVIFVIIIIVSFVKLTWGFWMSLIDMAGIEGGIIGTMTGNP